jgi:TPR repeat protein
MEFGEENTPLNVRRLIKDAEMGDREARFTLGYYYDVGAGGVQPNTDEAIHYYQLAAMEGHEIAQNNIGVLYSTGHRGRIGKDPAEAFHWYKKSALEFGNPSAQFHTGLAYLNGEGLEAKDDAWAFKFFKMAAKQGHLLSMSNVGAMYLGGRGIGMNYVKARKWLLKAAIFDDAVALHNLGVIYQNGFGCDSNLSLSDNYFHRSMSGINRGSIAKELHESTVAKAGTLYNS